MADGLPGHLHEFYRLVKDATWGGGDAEYSILNEAWPYYINGLVPLAFAVDRPELLDAVNAQIEYVLMRQHADGWLGPEDDLSQRNFWGRYPFFLAAMQYIEAAGSAESQQMLKAVHRFIPLTQKMLKNDYQGYVRKEGDNFDEQWGRSRAADMVLALQWLYENYPAENRDIIRECMYLIYKKAYDWSWWYRDDIFLKEDIETYPNELIDPLFPFLHVVNAAQGLKSPAVMGRLMHSASLFDASREGVELTFNHHGVSSGAIIGDERMSGTSPARGSELCSVVEAMFSLSTLYQILGDASFADRLENAAFNAMPAMIMPRWWAHQYVAQINQPYSYEIPEPHFWNVGPWGVTFGLEPNYPCCAVNFPQGYPKLLSAAWVKTPEDNGLAHVVLISSEVKIVLRNEHVNNLVHVWCETNYPFSQLLEYHVEAQEDFNFSFRVPEWVNLKDPKTGIYLDKDTSFSTSVQKPLTGSRDPAPLKPDKHTGLHTVALPAGTTRFSVYLSPYTSPSEQKPVIHARPNGAVSITHGALLFAHSLQASYHPRRPQNYQKRGEAPAQANDWTIVPRPEDDNGTTIPWNIAIDPSTARIHEYDNLYTNPDCWKNRGKGDGGGRCYDDWPNPIWAENAPPVSVTVLACEIEWAMTRPVEYEEERSDAGEEEWSGDEFRKNEIRGLKGNEEHDGRRRKRAVRGGYPVPPPKGKHGRHKCIDNAFPIELRPYGSAKIRIAEFPVVDLSPESRDLVDR